MESRAKEWSRRNCKHAESIVEQKAGSKVEYMVKNRKHSVSRKQILEQSLEQKAESRAEHRE